MLGIQKRFVESSLIAVLLITLSLLVSPAKGQELANSQDTQTAVARKNNPAEMKDSNTGATNAPVYKDFMGATLGMKAEEVRAKLGNLKNKGDRQDYFVFGESHSAQVVYDDQGKVITISVDYINKGEIPPSPESILGETVQAKPDGSMYLLKRYPEAGYWVAYSRTAGDDPIVTVTMQKI
jgi:hypothetical protein